MKKLMKVVFILLVLIGIGIGGYTSWLVIEKEKKLTFFTEDGPKEFREIEWSPTNSLWQGFISGDGDYGEKQEGYSSKGRLIFRHVQLDRDVPAVGYYFGLMPQVNQFSLHWVTDCEPGKSLKVVNYEGKDRDLYCTNNGKSLIYGGTVNPDGSLFQKHQWIDMSGFIFNPDRYGFDWKKLERNVALKGAFFD